jgi:hypothetical protein
MNRLSGIVEDLRYNLNSSLCSHPAEANGDTDSNQTCLFSVSGDHLIKNA